MIDHVRDALILDIYRHATAAPAVRLLIGPFGVGPVGPTLDAASGFEGYDHAPLDAVREHALVAGGDPRDLDIALFETLNRIVSIDDLPRTRLGERWDERAEKHSGQGQVVPAFRFVRNQVHHQWAQAVRLDGDDPGSQDWCWRTLGELPPSGQPRERQRAAFEQHLASRALRHTFRDLHRLFNVAFAKLDVHR